MLHRVLASSSTSVQSSRSFRGRFIHPSHRDPSPRVIVRSLVNYFSERQSYWLLLCSNLQVIDSLLFFKYSVVFYLSSTYLKYDQPTYDLQQDLSTYLIYLHLDIQEFRSFNFWVLGTPMGNQALRCYGSDPGLLLTGCTGERIDMCSLGRTSLLPTLDMHSAERGDVKAMTCPNDVYGTFIFCFYLFYVSGFYFSSVQYSFEREC